MYLASNKTVDTERICKIDTDNVFNLFYTKISDLALQCACSDCSIMKPFYGYV